MHPLPARQFMGVPADVAELAHTGLLSTAGLAQARREPDLPAVARDGDVPVAGYVAARFGQEVVDRLVDPLLGGVYAGRSEELSFEADAARPGCRVPPPRHAVRRRGRAAAAARGRARGVRAAAAGVQHRWPAGSARCRPLPWPPRPARSCGPARWCVSWPARRGAGG